MLHFFKNHQLTLLLPIAFAMYYLAFDDPKIFWYMYTFSLLVLMSISMLLTKFFDEMPTWKSLIYGVGFGMAMYGMIAASYQLLQLTPIHIESSVARSQEQLAPETIWHFLLLMFVIVPGEEIFWRGFVQQKMKKYMSSPAAVLVSSLLFALALSFSGFIPGVFAGLLASIILGFLYEWKKSLPLLIITHLVMIVLLFLVWPLSG